MQERPGSVGSEHGESKDLYFLHALSRSSSSQAQALRECNMGPGPDAIGTEEVTKLVQSIRSGLRLAIGKMEQ